MTRFPGFAPTLRFEAARALERPLWWVAVLVLALNDHVLKGSGLLPGAVTGKLSDVAGMLVAPVLIAVLCRARSQRALALCHALPLLVLAAIKLSPAIAASVVLAASWVGESWSIVADPTDLLVAVPGAAASWRWLARPAMRPRAAGRTVGTHEPASVLGAREILMVGLGALACGATSRTPPQMPAIDAGRVVAGPWGEDRTYVIDPQDGRAVVRLETPSGDPALVHDGALWTTRQENGGTSVVALDLATGVTRSALALPKGVDGTVGGVDAGFVYLRGYSCGDAACTWSTTWTAIDRTTTRPRWTLRTHAGARMAVSEGLAATTQGSRLIVRDVSGGVLHTRTFPARANVLALADGTLWVGDATGVVVALDARTGRPTGRWELGPDASGIAPENQDWRTTSSAAAADRLFVVVGDRVVVLRLGGARPAWERPGAHVAVTAGVAIIQQGDGRMSAYDASSGALSWSLADRGGWGRYAARDGLIAIREDDVRVSMIDARTGRVLSAFSLDEGVAAPLR